MYNVKNYTEPGGDRTVIGGTLEILDGAEVTGLPDSGGSASGSALEYPKTYQTTLSPALPTSATLEQVIEQVNDLRLALIANELMGGTSRTDIAFTGTEDTTDEVLKANAAACTVSYDESTTTISISCNPDALKAVQITVAPYYSYKPHKYIMCGFNIGNITSDTSQEIQINCTRYLPNAWAPYGLGDALVYVPIAVDAMAPGLNENAYFIQRGDGERKYFSVKLTVTA